jgi:glycosyltransferase involved in cell wall biosynthesis
MAAGLKIVSTDCPEGPAEILDHGRFGRLAPCGDAEALARAIEESLAEEPEPERQRTRAAKLNNETNVAKYLELMTRRQ